MSELLTTDEVARRLRVGRSTVYAFMARGELVGLRVGKRRLFTEQEVDEYIAAQVAAAQGRREPAFR
jgi:excisionase family DNA binding protein